MTNDLGPLPVESERQRMVESHRLLLADLMFSWSEGLTRAEEIALLSEYITQRAFAAVRKERES